MAKTCKVCGATKEPSEFYDAGKGRTCKVCRGAQVKQRARTNPAVQAYDRERAKRPEKRAAIAAGSKRWRAANPEKYRAQNAANNALRDGKLEAKEACERCGSTFGVHKHHHDYGRPLDVLWLCAMCHHRGHADECRATA